MKNRRRSSRRPSWSLPTGVLFGIVISLALMLAEAVLCAWLLDIGKIAQQSFGKLTPWFLALAGWVGAMCGYQKVGRQRLVVCMVSALGFWLVLLAIPALVFDGAYQRVGICAASILLGGLGAAMPAMKKPRKKYR